MKRSKIIGSIIFWLLTAAVMYIIFSFSSENGEQSKEVSEGVLSIIIEYLGNIVSHNVLRKIAHFTEYAALGFCMSGAVYFTFNKNKFYIPLIPCVLYAISWHQRCVCCTQPVMSSTSILCRKEPAEFSTCSLIPVAAPSEYLFFC